MFGAFKTAGLYDAQVDNKYKTQVSPTAGYRVWCCQTATGDCCCYCHNNAQVLAPGGKEDAAVLVANFLGRPYSFDAYEAWLANNQE